MSRQELGWGMLGAPSGYIYRLQVVIDSGRHTRKFCLPIHLLARDLSLHQQHSRSAGQALGTSLAIVTQIFNAEWDDSLTVHNPPSKTVLQVSHQFADHILTTW